MEKTYGSFELTQEGISLHVNWDKKDYEVIANIGRLQLKDYCHMMFMCPRIYTEEEVRKRCIDLIPVFHNAYKVITENTEIFSKKKEEYLNIKTGADSIIDDLNAKRREYKQQLKNGSLSKKDYDARFAEIKRQKDDLFFKSYNYLRDTARELSSTYSCSSSIVYNFIKDSWNLEEEK